MREPGGGGGGGGGGIGVGVGFGWGFGLGGGLMRLDVGAAVEAGVGPIGASSVIGDGAASPSIETGEAEPRLPTLNFRGRATSEPVDVR